MHSPAERLTAGAPETHGKFTQGGIMGLTVIAGTRPQVVVGRYYTSVQGASAVCEWRLSPVKKTFKQLKLKRIGLV